MTTANPIASLIRDILAAFPVVESIRGVVGSAPVNFHFAIVIMRLQFFAAIFSCNLRVNASSIIRHFVLLDDTMLLYYKEYIERYK